MPVMYGAISVKKEAIISFSEFLITKRSTRYKHTFLAEEWHFTHRFCLRNDNIGFSLLKVEDRHLICLLFVLLRRVRFAHSSRYGFVTLCVIDAIWCGSICCVSHCRQHSSPARRVKEESFVHIVITPVTFQALILLCCNTLGCMVSLSIYNSTHDIPIKECIYC